MATTAVLLGYGLFDTSNETYRGYVDGFIDFANSGNVERVVLCGGRTDPRRPLVSEAASMRDYMSGRLRGSIELRLEEESLTTMQNIEGAKRFVDLEDEIFVFCASAKLPKVAWCAMHYWLGMGRAEIAGAFISYFREHDNNHITAEMAGEVLSRGMTVRNIRFVPYAMWNDANSMLGNMATTLIEIEALYDRRLYDEAIGRARKKFGLAEPALNAQP